MISQRNWDEEGESAREADRVALIPRSGTNIPWAERERRGWWRQVAENRPPSGAESPYHGYIPPFSYADDSVPGESPGYADKGGKGKRKGKGKSGKRTRYDYERGESSRDPWQDWTGVSGGPGAGKGDTPASWWYPGGHYWDGWWNW